MKTYYRVGIVLLCFLLCACESAHVKNIVEKNTAPVGDSSPLVKSITVGNVEGEQSWPLKATAAASNDEYKEVLEKVLSKKNMLADEGQTSKYILSALIHSTYDGGITTGIQVSYDVKYTMFSMPDHTQVWEKAIQTRRNVPPSFDGNIVLNALFTSPLSALQNQVGAYDGAAHDNIYELIKDLESEPKFMPKVTGKE